jgi:hypothetical protein
MNGCLVAVGILVGLIALGVGYVLVEWRSIDVRYRLTIEVEDGNQLRVTSNVIDVSLAMGSDALNPPIQESYVPVYGYAPTVDLGEKGLLFLSFLNPHRTVAQVKERNNVWACGFSDIACLPAAVYRTPIINRPFSERKRTLKQLLQQSGPRDVPFSVLPGLVRFTDVDGVHKLVPVSPDDLAASFGPGVRLKRVILELTNDPITPMPPTWPQWLKESGKRYVGILEG